MKKLTNFPQKLREERKKRGYTQEEMAKLLAIGQSAYAKWENGRTEPTLDNIIKLANILDVTVDYLLGRSDNFSNTIVLSKNNMKSFSKRLKELRLEKNQTQQQLADELGVNRVNVTRWEKGNTEPSFSKLIELSKLLNSTQ
ncbi:helix-turn-helix transcriptional regulator, partial [Streptococcus agalactiae]|uniref:helix-turn-helix transcriptional regulator n=1 Tax=Streptococcus agalactiae TaxID=1311 RepID=UPI0020036E0D